MTITGQSLARQGRRSTRWSRTPRPTPRRTASARRRPRSATRPTPSCTRPRSCSGSRATRSPATRRRRSRPPWPTSRRAIDGNDLEAIKSATEELDDRQPGVHPEALRAGQPRTTRPVRPATRRGAGATGADDDDVVDAEIVDEDDDRRRRCLTTPPVPTSEPARRAPSRPRLDPVDADRRRRRRVRRRRRPPGGRRADDRAAELSVEDAARRRRAAPPPSATSTSTRSQRARPSSRTTASGAAKQTPTTRRPRPPSAWSSSCCRCSTPATPPSLHGATEVEPDLRRAPRDPGEGGPRARSTRPASAFDPNLPRGRDARAGRRRRRRPVVAEVLRTGYAWKGRVVRAGHGQGQGLAAPWPTRQREWFEKDYYKVLGVAETADAEGDHQAPTGSWPASSTPTPTPVTPPPRSASRRSPPPTTSSATPRSARSTTRSAPWARWAAGSAARCGFGGGGGGPAASTFDGRGDLGDLLGNLFGGGGGGRGRRRPAAAPARSAAPTSRPSCTSPSPTPSQGVTTTRPPHVSDAVCSHLPRQRAPSPAPRRRVCPHCGGRGVLDDNQGLFSFSTPVPAVRRPRRSLIDRPVPHLPRARASSAGPARSRSASRPASTTASASGSRAGAAPAATAARPATSTSSCHVDAAPAVRRATAATSRSPCRSPSPRPRSAPTSTVPTIDGEPVTLAHPGRHPHRAHASGSRAAASPRPRRTGDLLVTVEVAVPAKLTDEQRAGGRGARRRRRASRPAPHLGVDR